MRFIISSAGTTAIRVSADDVVPPHGVLSRDLIEFITSEYQFAVPPNIPPGMPGFAFPIHAYQSGAFVNAKGEKYPIIQLSVVPNGDIVTAATTDIAEIILNDLMSKLDLVFGYRFSSASLHKIYHSIIVVQFSPGIENNIKAITAIEGILNHNIPRPTMPFNIKRLAFGHGDVVQLFMPNSLEVIESADFLIERRTGEPYSENRYFSSAPVPTSDHINILDEIEQALS